LVIINIAGFVFFALAAFSEKFRKGIIQVNKNLSLGPFKQVTRGGRHNFLFAKIGLGLTSAGLVFSILAIMEKQ